MIEVMTWLEVNKKRLVIGAVVLVAVGFGAYVVGHLADQKEANASAALLKLRAPVNAGTNQVAIPSSDYLKVAAEHAGTAAEQRAVILAAGALFTEGKFADAQAQFERVQKDFTGSPWAADAAYGVAASLEAQGKRDEAVTAYQRVTAAYAAEPVANDAHLALARIYEAKGQPDLALKQYDELAKPGAGGVTMKTQEALMMRERLIKKFPSLAPVKTNAAAMTSIVAPTMSGLTPAAAATNKPAAAPVSTNKPATAPK